METKTINIYKYDELSETAKEKALSDFNDNNEHEFLSENLEEELNYHLEENKIKVLSEGDKKLYYSLGYSQGDGVCFVGNFEFKDKYISIRHNNHYYHKNSVNISIEDFEEYDDDLKNDLNEALNDEILKEFKEVYEAICDKLEKQGYSEIEYAQSEENFKEMCDANEYTFRENGELEN